MQELALEEYCVDYNSTTQILDLKMNNIPRPQKDEADSRELNLQMKKIIQNGDLRISNLTKSFVPRNIK